MAEAPLVVVDASVAVKWFVSEEDGVDTAAALLDAQADGEARLVAPSLVAHELMNVLGRGRRGDARLAEAMDTFFDTGIALVAPDRRLIALACGHVERHGVSTFDSAYSALAEALGCELSTADRGLARRLKGVVGTRIL